MKLSKALLWHLLHEDPECPSRVLLDKVAQRQGPLAGERAPSQSVAGAMAAQSAQGPPSPSATSRPPVASGAAVVQVTPRLSFVGVHLFAHWLDQQDAFGPVVAQLTQAVEAYKRAHPGDDFALLHHREQTLLRRFQALFFAPLLGIDRLTRVRYPRASAPDAAWPGVSQLNADVSFLGNLSASMPPRR